MKKRFKHNKIGQTDNYIQKNNFFSFSNLLKYFVILGSLALVIIFGKYLVRGAQITFGFLGHSTVKTVSENLGSDMIQDEYGNINVMLVGVGGENHHGGYLSDTIIVASWDPGLGSVTMISIPRDFYVLSTGYQGRINGLFARGYNKEHNVGSGAENLLIKVEEIVGLEIPYYAVVDFQGFKGVIDTLGGIDMYIPNTIHDTTYPDGNLGYITFHISAGHQTLDGETALMYARSRHTTSDFSRSHRQQEIIKAVVDKLLQKQNITNVGKLKQLYSQYTEMVTTNISLKEMIGAFKYIYNFEHMFTFNLNTYCSYRSYAMTDPGCFLYNGDRSAYGGMAIMVPNGSTPSNVSFYDYIQNFTFFTTHNPGYLIENPRILIKNGINKQYAYNNGKSPTGWANKLAVKLKKYGFNIADIDNSDEKFLQTTVITYDKKYNSTIETLQYFLPINQIERSSLMTGEELEYDMEIILGDDFIDYIIQSPFSYEK
ncbi:MAG TPA: LCP family protein [Candidatus Absconditabacterales bacterium]|nr:LCP family protein [Candidatus Absconditabacterales bacterium]